MPTQEAMAALGRQHLATLRKDVKTEVSVTKPKVTNQESKIAEENEIVDSKLSPGEFVMASKYKETRTNQVQFNRHDDVS